MDIHQLLNTVTTPACVPALLSHRPLQTSGYHTRVTRYVSQQVTYKVAALDIYIKNISGFSQKQQR